MRELSAPFLSHLLDEHGLLHAILDQVKRDDTLMLAIRAGYINIYYRGGNILKVTSQGNDAFTPFFDENYNGGKKAFPLLPKSIKLPEDTEKWVCAFPQLKEMMDQYLFIRNKPEREFQQLVARENNFSTVSNESEYFISDIEFADTGIGARLDMLAIRWLASQRKNGTNCRAALIEMKYGDDALGGLSGLLAHLKDIYAVISDRRRYKDLLSTMEAQFNQLGELGLLKYNKSANGAEVKLNVQEKPEVIFILANHNPRSSKLRQILNDPFFDECAQSERLDLRFYVPCFAGYGLHSDCMRTLSQFRELLKC